MRMSIITVETLIIFSFFVFFFLGLFLKGSVFIEILSGTNNGGFFWLQRLEGGD